MNYDQRGGTCFSEEHGSSDRGADPSKEKGAFLFDFLVPDCSIGVVQRNDGVK
jgi:hypothetical protein